MENQVALKERDVERLRALGYTSGDPDDEVPVLIRLFLCQYLGNIVYGPGAPQGIVLPTILTADAVLAAIEQAKGIK